MIVINEIEIDRGKTCRQTWLNIFLLRKFVCFLELFIPWQNDIHDYANFTQRKIPFVRRSPCEREMPLGRLQ